VSNDTGRPGDPYEDFLKGGRLFSGEKGWLGLEVEANEDTPAVLCYTYVTVTSVVCYVTYVGTLVLGLQGGHVLYSLYQLRCLNLAFC
jgi:hypothetical protein